jgi:hypothetical protein
LGTQLIKSDGGEVPDLASWLSGVTQGPTQEIGELTLVPLLSQRVPPQADTLIEEAIFHGQLEIVEHDGGTVQQLIARNRGSTDVLVLEGDTLVGCKQNRMVAWSVLVGAGTAVPVSVGCMERGRWSQGGPTFMAGEMAVDPHIRRRSKRETSASAARPCGPRLDQGRAWTDVDGKLREWHVSSETDDYHAGLLARIMETRARLEQLKPVAAQVGVIAMHQNRLLGLEAVAHPQTWTVLARRALPAYALGAESARRDPEFGRVNRASAAEWVRLVAKAAAQVRRAKGKGFDIVVEAEGITGSCLWHEDYARHLAVFAA